jgi:hypothetical protein
MVFSSFLSLLSRVRAGRGEYFRAAVAQGAGSSVDVARWRSCVTTTHAIAQPLALAGRSYPQQFTGCSEKIDVSCDWQARIV